MRLLRGLWKRAKALLTEHQDLVGWWWVLVAAQALIPPSSDLLRADLLPWMAVALAGAALLRVQPLAEGPHPQLRPQRSAMLGWINRAGAVLVPLSMLAVAEYAREPGSLTGRVAAGLGAAVLLARLLSEGDGRTGWRPPGLAGVRVGAGLLAVLVPGVLVGWIADAVQAGGPNTPVGRALAALPIPAGLYEALAGGLYAGLAFFALGLYTTRPEHAEQRRAAGHRDGGPYRPALHPFVFAAAGPLVGWVLVRVGAEVLPLLLPIMGVETAGQGLGGSFAYAAALHVVVWAVVLWRPATPVAVYCLLREMVPSGGADPSGTDGDLERSPVGSLRLHPLDIKPTRTVHVWVVPVARARVGELDDPVRPIFPEHGSPLSGSALGDASFALDPDTGGVQVATITVRLRGHEDTTALREGDVQVRRIVALRAWPPPGRPRRLLPPTWRWEAPIHADTFQEVDAATTELLLWDGSLVVLSSEGVARVYEVEIGRPIRSWHDLDGRVPQVEDYARP